MNFLFFPYHNMGGHFLCWSLYYLRAQRQYPSAFDEIRPVPAADAYSCANNFHHSKSIIVQGYQEYVQLLENLDFFQQFESTNIYLIPLRYERVMQKVIDQSGVSDQLSQTVHDIIAEDSQNLISDIQRQNFRFVFFDFAEQDMMSLIYSDRRPADKRNCDALSQQDLWQRTQTNYYANLYKYFPDDEIWDRREKLALILDPSVAHLAKGRHEGKSKLFSCVDQQKPHLYYTTDDVWNGLDRVIKEICEFVGIQDLDNDVFERWLKTYHQWRLIHDPWVARNINRILDAIVHNRYLSLKRFNLDFFKESLIQHLLMTRYNLNLKTWQLSTFPDNAQDLHRLLEPNIHHTL